MIINQLIRSDNYIKITDANLSIFVYRLNRGVFTPLIRTHQESG